MIWEVEGAEAGTGEIISRARTARSSLSANVYMTPKLKEMSRRQRYEKMRSARAKAGIPDSGSGLGVGV